MTNEDVIGLVLFFVLAIGFLAVDFKWDEEQPLMSDWLYAELVDPTIYTELEEQQEGANSNAGYGFIGMIFLGLVIYSVYILCIILLPQ